MNDEKQGQPPPQHQSFAAKIMLKVPKEITDADNNEYKKHSDDPSLKNIYRRGLLDQVGNALLKHAENTENEENKKALYAIIIKFACQYTGPNEIKLAGNRGNQEPTLCDIYSKALNTISEPWRLKALSNGNQLKATNLVNILRVIKTEIMEAVRPHQLDSSQIEAPSESRLSNASIFAQNSSSLLFSQNSAQKKPEQLAQEDSLGRTFDRG